MKGSAGDPMTVNYEEKVRSIIENIRKSGGTLSDMMKPEYVECDPEKMTSVIRYRRFKWEENGRGEVHGGVVSAMLDTSMGITAAAFLEQDVSTADLSVSFIRPFTGRSFIISSEVVHIGRRAVRLSARAHDEETGKLLASGTTLFMPVVYEQHKGVLGV